MSTWPPIESLIPHAGRMCLLDEVIACDAERIEARVTPSHDDLFAGPDGIGAHVGLEWMAQAVAAWARLNTPDVRGDAPPPGLLLGARRYAADRTHFAFNEPVSVRVALDFQGDNGMAGFHGELHVDGRCRVRAEFSVYRPPNTMPAD